MPLQSDSRRYSSRLVFAFLLLWAAPIFGQVFEDPNSPTPQLESIERIAGAGKAGGQKARITLSRSDSSEFFKKDEQIRLRVSNIELSEGEGASAFRVYGKDGSNRLYRFSVQDIESSKTNSGVFTLTVRLRDEIGFWEQPNTKKGLLLTVTWRGLASNSLPLIPGRGTQRKAEKKLEPKTAPEDYPTSEYVGYKWSGDRIRFLEQATFGPTEAEDLRIRRIGIRTWLAEQFGLPYPSDANPYPEIALKPNNIGVGCPYTRGTPEYNFCVREYYSLYPVQTWFFREAFYGRAQLRHRVAWALSQLWVTSFPTIRQSSHMIAYHKVLSDNAFGNFRTLMKEMTLNPAMGEYLDMARSTKNNPNENYAREILQLFTIGLFMLNQDGTIQTDPGGQPLPTYDQETVNNFTKVFTGWTFCNTGCPNSTLGAVNFKDPLVLNQNNHDLSEKQLLSYPNAVHENIPSGLNGNDEIDRALDNIFNHPNVGPFVGKFLIQHLVSSDPTPAYVSRVAAAFNNNGQGVRGDIVAVIRAILLDPEARGDIKTDPNYGKLREPVQFTTNIYRQFNVRSADGTEQSDGYVAPLPTIMSQNPFAAPTVFNYYPPNYVVPGTALLAPEFGLMNTGSSIARANIATFLSFSQINPDNRVPPNAPMGTSIDLGELSSAAQGDLSGNLLLDKLDRKMMHGKMSAGMRASILQAVLAVPADSPEFRARTALFLVASSSQFQIQR